ncbi:hypothetical protein [endosymbiont GvMRE of Glomus versiforme]|uniref:hypothetical protein n=1 Tax=endosymbiont GvMRE of Glomus versiforme TaxID=2039283 RepID=UPI000EDFF5D2|nr:hypothetical protein [endosymbiont GvMRE of Glomus versiforme]RHZ35652.1 hypothetical protein GvMRE_IIg537 [endosymbiont GvMRE of Glomus versiforme]
MNKEEKRRMIVVFLVFLLAMIASRIFIYKVSKNTRDSSQQSEKQIEKAEIPLQVLLKERVRRSDWESIKTKGFVYYLR